MLQHHGIFTTLIMGAAVAEFGLTGVLGPGGEGASETPAEQADVVSEHRPAAKSGVADLDAQGISPEEYAAAVMDRLMPAAPQGGPPPGYEAPPAEIAQDISDGVYYLDNGVRKIPGYALHVVGEVEKHGIAALAYTDPETKRAGHQLGVEIGSGVRSLASALGKDMTATARETTGHGRF